MRNLSKRGYILNSQNEIENLSYRDYLAFYGSDETTTPLGVGPRLYVDGNSLMSWGVGGNNNKTYRVCDNKRSATKLLFECWKKNVEDNWDAPKFFDTKKEFFKDLEGTTGKDVEILKRYFKIKQAKQEHLFFIRLQAKKQRESEPIVRGKDVLKYLSDNWDLVENSLKELRELKELGQKEQWQVKANALIQKVSKNDFRALKWKEIYGLIINYKKH